MYADVIFLGITITKIPYVIYENDKKMHWIFRIKVTWESTEVV